MNQKRFLRLLMFVIVSCPWLLAAQVADHLLLSDPPSTVLPGIAFPLGIQAIGLDQAPLTNFSGALRLTVALPDVPSPMISEVFLFGHVIEVANPTDISVDVSGWELHAIVEYGYYGSAMVTPTARLRLPPNSVLPPRGVFTWTDQGDAPGAFPAFVSSKRFVNSYGFKLVRLFRADGSLVDEVFLDPTNYSPPDALWKGLGLVSCPSDLSHTRIGSTNRFRRDEWITAIPSLGATNSGLLLPWTNTASSVSLSPAVVQAMNGSWSGSVTLPSAARPGVAWFNADNNSGVSGQSTLFTISSTPSLTLEIPTNIQSASESQAGLLGSVTVLIPDALTNDLTVLLTVSGTNEFSVPAAVVIAAGDRSGSFPVTNFDDAVADGAAIVTLTASAPGFAAATATLVNEDNEQGGLYVFVTSPVSEDSGFGNDSGQVFLGNPAPHDILVRLDADLPLEVPTTLVIPAGHYSASFRIRVGDDALVNPYPHQLLVRAQIANWPQAVGTVTVQDDEDRSFTFTASPAVLEATSGTGRISVRVAHQFETTFNLTSANPRLVIPTQVVLPPGALSIDFPLQTINDTVYTGHSAGDVCAETAGLSWFCSSVTILDDEVSLSSISLASFRPVIFSGASFPFTASIVDGTGQVQQTNALGSLDLSASSSLAALAPGSSSVQFTNGLATSNLVINGQGLGVKLRVSAAGLSAESPAIDVLPGTLLGFYMLDAVWNPQSGQFLIALPIRTNAPAQLSEFDPFTRTWGRTLDLPRTVRRIALSDDGSVAWLASTNTTLQRIDLTAWQFGAEYRVEPGTTKAYAVDLVVLPGQSEKVVAVTSSNSSPMRVVMYDHGVLCTNQAALPGYSSSIGLIAGRDASEVFCQSWSYLTRFNVLTNGITTNCTVPVGGEWMETPSLHLFAGRIYRGSGEVFLSDTLDSDIAFAQGMNRHLGLPCPDRNTMFFIEHSNNLKSYDFTTRQPLAGHGLPDSSLSAQRLLRWGEQGLATFSTDAGLALFETPTLSTNLPDLVLTAHAPDIVTLSPANGTPIYFNWEFGVTNGGPEPAFGVQLSLDSGQVFELGSLAPGEGTVVTMPGGSYWVDIFKAVATLRSAGADLNPSDNVATVVTRVKKPDLASTGQLVLGATHLIASPNGDRLYAAVAKSAGDAFDGVAVVNPELDGMESFLPLDGSPQHLAISSDGAKLHVLLGTNCLVRWNLATALEELRMVFANDTIVDFLGVPGLPDSVVVSTTSGVSVYDNGQSRASAFVNATAGRYLGIAGDALWTAESGALRQFNITDSGLVLGATIPFSLVSGFYPFTSDGRNLFFSGAIYDTLTGVNTSRWLGDVFCPDTNNARVFTSVGSHLISYSVPAFQQLGDEWLANAGADFFSDIVRWGPDGVAIRTGKQILMVRTPLVPSSSVADIGVSVVPPPSRAFEPIEWTVILTNHSDVVAPRTVLYAEWSVLYNQQVAGPDCFQSYSSLVYDAGDIPAHGFAVFHVRGVSFDGSMAMSANALTAASDLNSNNNSASVYLIISPPQADLTIVSSSMPSSIQIGDEFVASFTLSNAGPDRIEYPALSFSRPAQIVFLGVVNNAFPTNDSGMVYVEPLPPGGSRQVSLRLRASGSGIIPFFGAASAPINDPVSSNNSAGSFIYVPPIVTTLPLTHLSLPSRPILAWDSSRQELLAAFPQDSWNFFVLDPVTLAPVRSIQMPWLPEHIAPCNNGRHAWVSLAGKGAVRVDLITMTMDSQFDYTANQSSIYAVAARPGQSNALVVAINPDFVGPFQTRAYVDGVALPVVHPYLPQTILFAPDGRLFVSSTGFLRQLAITSTGLTEVRNLDFVATWPTCSFAANRLFQSAGRIVDSTTGAVDDRLIGQSPLMADSETSLAYWASSTWHVPRSSIMCMDAATLNPLWRIMPPVEMPPFDRILPMGTNGCLAFAGSVCWLVRPNYLGATTVDLGLAMSVLPAGIEIGMPFPVQLSITNKSNWAAQDTVVRISLSTNLVFAPGSFGAGSSSADWLLSSLTWSNSMTASVLATSAGSGTVTATAVSSTPELNSADNSRLAMVEVAARPVLFIDDVALPEGSSYRPAALAGWLSRPAPTNLQASFTVELLTAQSNDFSALSGVFEFAAGQQRATVSIHSPDSTPEADETARLTFSSTNILLARESILLTLVNDDLPQATIVSATINEGTSGYANGYVSFSLSPKLPFPVDVQFQTAPGTATPMVDYIPRHGWVHFEPFEDSKAVPIPVVGDIAYEPDETVYISLVDARGAKFSTTPATLTIRNFLPAPQVSISRASSGQVRLDFGTIAGATYRVQSRTNLTSDPWRTLGYSSIGNGSTMSFTLPQPTQKIVYYRLLAY